MGDGRAAAGNSCGKTGTLGMFNGADDSSEAFSRTGVGDMSGGKNSRSDSGRAGSSRAWVSEADDDDIAGIAGSLDGAGQDRAWSAAWVSITVGAGNCGTKGVTGAAGSREGSEAEGTGSGGNEAGRDAAIAWPLC